MSLPGTLLHRSINGLSYPLRAQRSLERLGRAGRLFAAAILCSATLTVTAQDYKFDTFAGMSGFSGSTNGTGTANGKAFFSSPNGIVVDGAGFAYVTDTDNNTIRKISPAGEVTTLAGAAGSEGSTDGTGSTARFKAPQGGAIDASGNIYVADYGNHTIRKITPAGVVTTLAGSPSAAGSANGTGSAARFNRPIGVAVDSSGNVYVADSDNNLIRKVTSAGVVTTLAGTLAFGWKDDTGTAASFRTPHGVAVDSSGNVYVADTGNNTIRKITSAGVVTTLAGAPNTYGTLDGTGAAARFDFPNSLVVDIGGNVYVTDSANHTIRKITPAGVVTTLAGSPGPGGVKDDTGTAARFNHPSSISLDASGNLFVSDYTNQLIRKITPAGVVTTLAGVALTAGNLDGTGYSSTAPSLFYGPTAVAADTSTGNIIVADTNNQLIRQITPAGVTTTVAGSTQVVGTANGTGTAARFSNPTGVALDGTTIYVADNGNHVIRKIATGGVVTTHAGTMGTFGKEFVNTPPTAAFYLPSSVAVDGSGNVYVADYNNHNIRKVDSSGVVTIFAGTGAVGSADGNGTAASFNHPRGLALAGNSLYVTDSGNHTVRQISLTAPYPVSTLAGTAKAVGSTDGAAAKFNTPWGITVDPVSSVVFVADTGNHTIRAISPSKIVTTLGGSPGQTGKADGIGSAARFHQPTGITFLAGKLYIADYRNNTIRVGEPATTGPGAGPAPITGTTPTGNGQILRPEGITNSVSSATEKFFFVADTANNSIKKIAEDGTVTTFAGSNGTAGSADGTGTAASFRGPTALTLDSVGNIYVADTGNALIRKITPAGVVTTIAGSATARGNTDAVGTAATFQSPAGIAYHSSGYLFVADAFSATIRSINPAEIAATATTTAVPALTVKTVAGLANTTGDADGVAGAARFNNPTGVAVDGLGFLYVADTNNSTVRKMNIAEVTTVTPAIPAFTVSTMAGSAGISGSVDGWSNYALFSGPTGISATERGDIFVTDTDNSLIRAISPAGQVSTIAGIVGIAAYREGFLEDSLLNHPKALTVASDGTVFIADTGNSSIRYIRGDFVYGFPLKAPTTTTTTTGSTGSTGSTSGSTPSSSGGGTVGSVFVGCLAALFVLSRKPRRRAA